MAIRQKKGVCIDCPPGCVEVPLIAKRCQLHYWRHRAKEKQGKAEKRQRISPIAKKSDNRIDREIEYAKIRKAWLPLHPVCEAKLKGCQGAANQVHHMAGRSGVLLCDTDKWLAVCHNCHRGITEHSAAAIEAGLSLRRNQ